MMDVIDIAYGGTNSTVTEFEKIISGLPDLTFFELVKLHYYAAFEVWSRWQFWAYIGVIVAIYFIVLFILWKRYE